MCLLTPGVPTHLLARPFLRDTAVEQHGFQGEGEVGGHLGGGEWSNSAGCEWCLYYIYRDRCIDMYVFYICIIC